MTLVGKDGDARYRAWDCDSSPRGMACERYVKKGGNTELFRPLQLIKLDAEGVFLNLIISSQKPISVIEEKGVLKNDNL